ncbi:cyclase family protein [Halospeciosus flavus]|uniref:Cyclase family protein n=1 Tax=Halospeciosus flavus TaxID=3032283 RepID=A0ABD5Z470_9EURY|nr:cyclase family protein [Halospeciosus flavus]
MPLADLSRPVESDMPVYPGDPPVAVEPHATHDEDGYAVSELRCGTHTGTHVDAPSHVLADGDSLGDFALDQFRFDARRVDCRHRGARDAVTVGDLPVPGGADLLVLDTGWASHWGSDRYRDHPYLSPAAAEWCADRGCGVAVDAFGPDPTPSPNATEDEPNGFPAHEALLGARLPIVENVCNLDVLPDRFTLHAYPLPVDADAAPVRAVAEW